jgi:hypothetical protein
MKKEETQTPIEIDNLHSAIIKVMQDVKNIDKSMTIGEGRNSYKGVADKDVKFIIGQSMAKNGLTCLPINIQPSMKVERWEAVDYSGKPTIKQSVFTEVLCTYKITHSVTNESIEIQGYGHGVDAQDKSAGKALTYALKNALLYMFLVPTGSIEDTDNTHSDKIETPAPTKPEITPERFVKALEAITAGTYKKETLEQNFNLTKDQKDAISKL